MSDWRSIQIVLLVEDESLKRFALRVLGTLGIKDRRIRVLGYPVGHGSAKQWVTDQYAREVSLYRQKANHLLVGLLVGTEADELTVEKRARQLENALAERGLPKREDKERIAHWIPKWSIETWILHLNGQRVDELSKQRSEPSPAQFQTAADTFVEEYRNSGKGRIESTLDSLKYAYKETQRLFKPDRP